MLTETPQHTRLLRDNNRFFLIIENLMADDVMRFFIFLLYLINKYVHCSVISAHQQKHIIGQYFS